MINNLRIKNFKCFENLQVELSNLNVFAGINSMGKSSVIQAMLLLRQSYEMGTLAKGLHLNGDLTQIGTGFDLMYRNSDKDEVSMGRKVTIKELPDEEPESYQIVGESESDPFNGKISNESPMAKGLLGHKVGEEVEIEIPNGTMKVKILSVE